MNPDPTESVAGGPDVVFEALADPVRRSILERLRMGPVTAGDLAGGFPISRPAVSRHLRVLRQAGLVSADAKGRSRIYQVVPGPIIAVAAWADRFADTWPKRLDALETEVYRTRRHRRQARGTTSQEREETA